MNLHFNLSKKFKCSILLNKENAMGLEWINTLWFYFKSRKIRTVKVWVLMNFGSWFVSLIFEKCFIYFIISGKQRSWLEFRWQQTLNSTKSHLQYFHHTLFFRICIYYVIIQRFFHSLIKLESHFNNGDKGTFIVWDLFFIGWIID